MPTIIKTQIVKIGNSQGIRIPKLLLQQTNLSDEVELEMQSNQIIIRPIRRVRRNWEETFETMARLGDDALLDGDVLTPTAWDDEEWQW